VVLLEPTPSFINEAIKLSSTWRGIPDASKSVTFVQGTLQDYDFRTPITVPPSSLTAASTPPSTVNIPSNGTTGKVLNLGRVGYTGRLSSLGQSSVTEEEEGGGNEEGFDVIWCQWCLGHLSDTELVAFFKACKEALRSQIDEEDVRTRSLIIVKENVCFDGEDGAIRSEFDERDSSVTRSDQAWKTAFREAGLTLVKQQTQLGLPHGLYTVNMYALR